MSLFALKAAKPFPFIKQRDMTECGTTCLAMILKHYGLYNIQAVLRDMGHVTAQGTDLFTISELAELFGFVADGYQMEFEYLPEVKLPCIAHYEGNHFVVIYKVSKDFVWIADPGIGKFKMSK